MSNSNILHTALASISTHSSPCEVQVSQLQHTALATTFADNFKHACKNARTRKPCMHLRHATGALRNPMHAVLIVCLYVCLYVCACVCVCTYHKPRSDIEAQRTELSSCQSEEGRLEGSVRELRERVSGLRADSQGSAHSSQLVTALMTARAKGELKGVYGRLGERVACIAHTHHHSTADTTHTSCCRCANSWQLLRVHMHHAHPDTHAGTEAQVCKVESQCVYVCVCVCVCVCDSR